MKVVDHTKKYNGQAYIKYINTALTALPTEDTARIGTINLHDSCPKEAPVIAKGGHYPATASKEGAVDIYLDQCFGHMLSYHSHKNLITKQSDKLFILTFGKLHLIHTLFHEIGHQMFEDQRRHNEISKKKKEAFADEYANQYYPKFSVQYF